MTLSIHGIYSVKLSNYWFKDRDQKIKKLEEQLLETISRHSVLGRMSAGKSYMFSVLSMSQARLHWPFAFLCLATLSLSICSRSFFHRMYSSCSSLDVGMLRSVPACRFSGSYVVTKHLCVY